MAMKRIMSLLVPGWERFTGSQRAACIDFGLSVSVLLLMCCSDSVLLALLSLGNAVRSYFRLVRNHIDVEE